ncbi:hypothetical protein [Ensifer sp. BR816]|uniref:hypothetical protein n=1 Tax=Rhizobium sp. (strain BR816) TaxID=1057002 RepID=UPI000380092B|nr:hypothetical protein [Ensifer sp. BR816]
MIVMFAIRLSHVNEGRKIEYLILLEASVMPVLVVPASPNARQSSPLKTAVEHFRLRRVIEAYWALVIDRGDPHLIDDAGLADIERPMTGWWPDPIRHSHWML